ncbi:hypothetical protein KKD62_02785 [Patescibacteria group bacterium]|nr:hypothetical protein [Patescibacteria group bacterium]MBU1931760.1 hypothetical protein [Patescibacteria group bacterium]
MIKTKLILILVIWLSLLFLTTSRVAAQSVLVNHENVNADIIPESWLDEARKFDIFFGHQSVGQVITYGDDTGSAGGLEDLPRPRYEISIVNNPTLAWYSNNNGWGESLIGANFDPQSKVNAFSAQMQVLGSQVDIAIMKFCYVDFANVAFNDIYNMYVNTMESLENNYPGVIFVWWTAPLTRSNPSSGYGNNADRYSYNQMIRSYAASHNKILFDVADIESHDLSGDYCYNTVEREFFCDGSSGYDNFVGGTGHPNALGAERLSRSIWWLLARLAGWNPDGPPPVTPTSTPAPTLTSTPTNTPTPVYPNFRQLLASWLTSNYDQNADAKVNSFDFASPLLAY